MLLAGCRIERHEDVIARDSIAVTESLRVEGPPVIAGDTIRVGGPADLPTPSAPLPPVSTDAPSTRLLIPVQGIRPQDLTDTFTDARGQGRRHDAIDIIAPRGTPVVAAAAGRVLRLFTSDRGGLTVYQLGEDGRSVYYYAHLDAYAPGLAQGQMLTRGAPIGTVGDSGNAVPGNTHLHFAVWTVDDPAQFWDGEPVNPYPLLVARATD